MGNTAPSSFYNSVTHIHGSGCYPLLYMKTSLLILAFLTATFQLSFAGGNSSIVELYKISSIKIETERVIIVGSGMLRKRVMSDAEHGDSSVFGQPAQMLHAKVTDCQFEIIPYHKRSDVAGVPGSGPDHMSEEMKVQSMKWWAGTRSTAKEIKVGDAITIGYQREKMTIISVCVTKVVGSGSVTIKKAKNDE